MPTTTSNFDQIRSWLNEINREKQAAHKSAKPLSEPTGRGSTTHPIADVDDQLHKQEEGSRSSENEKDIKKDQPAGNVNEAGEKGPSQEDLNMNMGVEQSATGEDPKTEDNYKGKIKDPGTTHPANTDDLGEKYSSYVSKEAAFLSNLANEIMADIATGVSVGTKHTQKQASAVAGAPSTNGQAKPVQPTQEPGYELANLLGFDKSAADQTTQVVIEETIKRAQDAGDRVGSFLVSFMNESETLLKKAMDDESAAADAPVPPSNPMGPGDGAEVPPEMAGGEGGDPTAALAAAAGGGGDPMMGGGEMMPPEGGEGGGAGNEQALQELAMALMELGISPEELAAAVAQGGAGGDPAAGGAPMAPPPQGSPADMGAKIASAVHSYKRSGRFEIRAAKTAQEKEARNQMKSYILEILGSTR